MTIKKIISKSGYSLPTNWKDLSLKDKKYVVKTIKDAFINSIKPSYL